MLAIIPCCGFGTRMNMRPDQSKELLINPTTNKPLIQYWLDICKDNDLEPLLLIRPEKTDLIEFCKQNSLRYVVMPPGKEWADTIYRSHEHWSDKNIVFLPDTNITPVEAVGELVTSLKVSPMVMGVFPVDDSTKWCVLSTSRNGDVFLAEKQKVKDSFVAVGVWAFEKEYGIKMFKDLSDSNYHFNVKTLTVPLESFVDLTRTGKLNG